MQDEKDADLKRHAELERERRAAARAAEAEKKAQQEEERNRRLALLRSKVSLQKGEAWLDANKRSLPDSYFPGVSGLTPIHLPLGRFLIPVLIFAPSLFVDPTRL